MPCPQGPVVMILESDMLVAKEEKKPMFLPSYTTYKPQQWPTWQDISNGIIVELLFWE